MQQGIPWSAWIEQGAHPLFLTVGKHIKAASFVKSM
jgi:hypothetical protein